MTLLNRLRIFLCCTVAKNEGDNQSKVIDTIRCRDEKSDENDFYGVDTLDVPFVGDGYDTTRCRDTNIEETIFYGRGTLEKPFVYNGYESESATNKTAHSDDGDMENMDETEISCTLLPPHRQKYSIKTIVLKEFGNKPFEGVVISFDKYTG